jgi:hypothetical protein
MQKWRAERVQREGGVVFFLAGREEAFFLPSRMRSKGAALVSLGGLGRGMGVK